MQEVPNAWHTLRGKLQEVMEDVASKKMADAELAADPAMPQRCHSGGDNDTADANLQVARMMK
jgi:hypothetical protein